MVPRDLDHFGLAIVVGGSFEVRHISGRVLPSGSNAAALAAMPVTAATASIIDAIGTVQAIDSFRATPRGQYVDKGQELFLIDARHTRQRSIAGGGRQMGRRRDQRRRRLLDVIALGTGLLGRRSRLGRSISQSPTP